MSMIVIRPEDIPPEEDSGPSAITTPITITRWDIWKQFLSELWTRIGSRLGWSKVSEHSTSTVQVSPVVLSLPPEPAPVIPRPEAESVAECPYCRHPLEESETTTCNICKTPHHKECWEANGGCTTLACRNNPLTAARR